MKRRFNILFLSPFLAFALCAYSVGWTATPSDDDFDRLDGHGKSGKRVDVIEWEGNLEIHVYPKNSLAGLALKLDEKQQGKKVMVIGYRFHPAAGEQLIRRALISIPFKASFQAFQDPSTDDYDKVIISNQGLSGQVVAFKLDPTPEQLYPAEVLAQQKADEKAARTPANETGANTPRAPSPSAPRSPTPAQPLLAAPTPTTPDSKPVPVTRVEEPTPEVDEDGGIRHFAW